MAFTATELITNSFYLGNIVARGEETVSGDQLSDGLSMLNEFLAVKTVEQRLIPYFSTQTFTGVISPVPQETYFISGLIDVDTLTFTIDSVRYSMNKVGREVFFGTSRANNVASLPYQYFVERAFGGANISMYFLPSMEYEFTIHGKFSLNNVVLNQDLSLTVDQFYTTYLKYGLANFICQEYGQDFPVQQAMFLKKLEAHIYDVSPLDLSLNKRSTLSIKNSPDIYGMVNIGKGWVP